MSSREGLQPQQEPGPGHPQMAQEQPRAGDDPAPPEGDVSVPWARFGLRSQGSARAFESNLQADGKAWGKTQRNNNLEQLSQIFIFNCIFQQLCPLISKGYR